MCYGCASMTASKGSIWRTSFMGPVFEPLKNIDYSLLSRSIRSFTHWFGPTALTSLRNFFGLFVVGGPYPHAPVYPQSVQKSHPSLRIIALLPHSGHFFPGRVLNARFACSVSGTSRMPAAATG